MKLPRDILQNQHLSEKIFSKKQDIAEQFHMARTLRRTMRIITGLLLHPWRWQFASLEGADLDTDPFREFSEWFGSAKRCWSCEIPNAMCLSTVDAQGAPEGRMVLLDSFDGRGFVFYSDCNSRKGRALAVHPRAGLTFYWEQLHRQVRVQGRVETTSNVDADTYFSGSSRKSQLHAWSSNQSQHLESRDLMKQRMRDFDRTFACSNIPRPSNWIGYRVVPERFEFLLTHLGGLHDRFAYSMTTEGQWKIERLFP